MAMTVQQLLMDEQVKNKASRRKGSLAEDMTEEEMRLIIHGYEGNSKRVLSCPSLFMGALPAASELLLAKKLCAFLAHEVAAGMLWPVL